MPDACQDACSGLTCADYAHETCELARLVGCLCAGFSMREFLRWTVHKEVCPQEDKTAHHAEASKKEPDL